MFPHDAPPGLKGAIRKILIVLNQKTTFLSLDIKESCSSDNKAAEWSVFVLNGAGKQFQATPTHNAQIRGCQIRDELSRQTHKRRSDGSGQAKWFRYN